MDLLTSDLLRQIFLHLHPFTLQTCKLVCKRWQKIIIQPEIAQWLFIQRYNQKAPQGITYWDQYYPLPGGEKYRGSIECYADAHRHKNKAVADYFFEWEPGKVYNWATIFELPSGLISREQLEYVRIFIDYNESFNYFHEYGVLVGLHGDLQLFTEEYVKIPEKQLQAFSIGFIKGLCLDGHPKIKEIFATSEVKINDIHPLVDLKTTDIIFRRNYPEISLITQHLTPYQAFKAKVPYLTYEEIIDYPQKELKYSFQNGATLIAQIIRENRKPGLSKYLMKKYPEDYWRYLSTPRSWLYHRKLGHHPKRSRLYEVYQEIILEGDWEIYDEFVEVFYPRKWIDQWDDRSKDYTRHVLIGKRPKQRLLYKPVYKLIETGQLKKLYEVLVRLDFLHVTKKEAFYQHCLYAAIRYGKKDLVEYFLLCLKSPQDVFPLSQQKKWPEMRKYLDYLNKKFQGENTIINGNDTQNSS